MACEDTVDVSHGQPDGPDARAVRPAVPRTTLRRWQTWYDTREGAPWERMLDGRLPPKTLESPESWQSLVRGLGRQKPPPSFSAIRDALVAEFGREAGLCDKPRV